MTARYFRKFNLVQSPRGVLTWMQSLIAAIDGVWPVYSDLALELCQVHSLRFDDPWLYAGWVVYTTSIPESSAPLMLDWHYPAATIELYDLPAGSAIYLTDAQEPGGYASRAIGPAFERLGEFIAANMGQPPRRDVDADANIVWLEPTDQLIVIWLEQETDIGIDLIAQRLMLTPGDVAQRLHALGSKGRRFPRRGLRKDE